MNLTKDKNIEILKKPNWIRVKLISNIDNFNKTKNILRANNLVTVCEEASCPNIGECFGRGVATFMIMGSICTRRCKFCNISHGRPDPLDIEEPKKIAYTINKLKLNYVVITSVNRDDLHDGGSSHFVSCIKHIRKLSTKIKIEILIPDFRNQINHVLKIFKQALPDVLNHNIETVPRLYKKVRPGSDYKHSLNLLKNFKKLYPNILTKSGIMVGLGENDEEILTVIHDMRNHNIDILTIGQYLMPSRLHLPVHRYLHPKFFEKFKKIAYKLGFKNVLVGSMIRSSYMADKHFF
ncbi:lipoyl synthase [Candidatus Profftella armatura]|uniref:Lipoyl synthase n=1 Tax=Candidatus Profftella armatura TaxID=669502 RepID=S5R3Y0_9PROT|nr:lipoyl synthase [Candidatus Profftella armatura]AGS06919.1 lipoyl synthase [Candidatus Profftella armatura]QLK13827.1 lipoyl synthase [Candidatus Profftella armatura]